MALGGSVGRGGDNAADDVLVVKRLLNLQARRLQLAPLAENSTVDDATDRAIKAFQQAFLGIRQPDGVIAPGSPTLQALEGQGMAARQAIDRDAAALRARLSGAAWFEANQAKYPNSSALDALAPGFAPLVGDFIDALRDAGAHVTVSATRRNRDRAFIMHWAWKVAHGKVKASAVPANRNVDIVWDHGNDKASREGAAEMVKAFAIAYQPSLTSRHIDGLAIDMSISWTGPIEVTDRNGKDIAIDQPRNGARNDDLHRVGKTYGVIKLLSDPPHWSSDGH